MWRARREVCNLGKTDIVAFAQAIEIVIDYRDVIFAAASALARTGSSGIFGGRLAEQYSDSRLLVVYRT